MPLTIDVHHHILPDFFWEATNEQHGPVGGIAPAHWSPESALSFIDEAQIDVAVTSISTPGVHLGDDAAARVLARRCNEFSAELMQKHPARFGAFACVPLPDVEGSLREISYALDVLKLDGVVVFSNANGIYLGERQLAPVFEELQRRAAVVFIHPNASPDPAFHRLGLPDSLLDFPADTSRAIANLHYSNTFARTPDVKYIVSHAGGTIPYVAGRFGIVDEMGIIEGTGERGTAADTLRRLYWDTALSWKNPILQMLRSVVGMDQVLYGTDFPYLRRDLAVQSREDLESTPAVTEAERGAVLGANALKLFPRLRALV
jgi:predicted TIM-barrel fold metal-dependent hydrolase